MPYSNIEAEMLQVQDGGGSIDKFPESVQLLYTILNDESDGLHHSETILLASGVNDTLLTTGDIDVSSVNDSSLLILDKRTNRLIQYDVKENKYHDIANQGRGPGDLDFSRELSVFDNKAFIGMGVFQISMFTCHNELCEYAKTINTDFNNYSLAPGDGHIKFLGISRFGGEDDPDPSNTDQNLIHKINYDGEVQQSFFPIYRDRSPLIREAMNSRGRVRLFPELNVIVVAFAVFPYLYVHDAEGKLTDIYELPDFIQKYYESEKRAGGYSSRSIYASNSTISHSSQLNERWLLLRLREVRDLEFHGMEEGFTGTQWFSYYSFDVAEKTLYKIGDDTIKPVGESQRVLHVVDQGVVINENGLLYLLLN
tara:strand:- start:2914 stop:4017 length:1104 start_codon:yes stop_codon:yes gene_type:complete